jgi:hypothetical protein
LYSLNAACDFADSGFVGAPDIHNPCCRYKTLIHSPVSFDQLVSPSVCPLATCDAITAEAAQNPICPLDIQLCSDGNGYLKPEFRDNENECQFKADCELPGLKSRQPLECAETDVVGSGDKGAFPLVIGEDGKISIEYGTETPSVPVSARPGPLPVVLLFTCLAPL